MFPICSLIIRIEINWIIFLNSLPSYNFLQHSTISKKPSKHQKVLQTHNLSEFESVIMERPQFSRQKDFQQQQVISAPKSYKDKNKALYMEFPFELNTKLPLEHLLTLTEWKV